MRRQVGHMKQKAFHKDPLLHMSEFGVRKLFILKVDVTKKVQWARKNNSVVVKF